MLWGQFGENRRKNNTAKQIRKGGGIQAKRRKDFERPGGRVHQNVWPK